MSILRNAWNCVDNDQHQTSDCIFVQVGIGCEKEWNKNDPENPFRKDAMFRVKALPTLMNMRQTNERLEADDSLQPDKVRAFLKQFFHPR